jgi:hypothetical protein
MATTFTWIPTGTSNWNNTANWTDSTVPDNSAEAAAIVNGGTANVDFGIEIIIDTLTIGAASAVGIVNDAVLEVNGDILNQGTLSIDGTNNTTELRVAGGTTVSLSGGGVLNMAGTGNNIIRDAEAATGELINVDNTIEGAGIIGDGDMALDNQSGGTIDSDTTGLTIDSNGAGATNEGLIEATNGAALALSASKLTQTGGTLLATGTNSVVELINGVVVTGGTLTSTSGGLLETASNNTVTLSNLTLTAGSTYTGQNNTITYLNGTIDNAGTLALAGANNAAVFRVEGGQTLTLTGGGVVNLAGTGNNGILDADAATGELINVNNTIEGGGNIGIGEMALDNQAGGTIDSNSTGLTLQPNAAGSTNEGLIEATAGATLALDGGKLTQTGGTVLATGTNSVVQLSSNVVVTGGTLTTTNGGAIVTLANNTVTLSNLTLTAGSTYTGQNNTFTYLNGTIGNAGTLALAGTNNAAEFRVEGGQTLTLTGGGVVNLAGTGNNFILDADAATGALINVNNTIEGGGNIGDGQLSLDNQASGTIDSNSTGLTLQPNAAGYTNEGLIEATAGATLALDGNKLTQTGGTLLASGTGSLLELFNSVNVTGGVLTALNGGAIITQANFTATLNNVTLTAGSTYTGENNTNTYLAGTIDNLGTLALDSGNNDAEYHVEGGQTLTLTGGGVLAMMGSGNNFILDSDQATGLLVNVNNTIEGNGNIGNGQLSLDNQAGGTIDSNSTGLTLQPNTTGYTNEGLIEATGGASLALEGSTLTQTGGTLLASGAGSIVQLFNSAVVTGGMLTTTGGGSMVTEANATASLTNLTITSGSNYSGLNNTSTFLTGTINNQGTIGLAATNNSAALRIADGTTLTGGGTIALSDNPNNQIWGSVNNGLETVTNVNNTVEGSGILGFSNSFEFINQKGGVIDATGTAAALTIAPTTAGTMAAANGGGFINLGLLEATNTAGLILENGQFNNATGTIQAAGAGNDVFLQNTVTISGGVVEGTGDGEVETENNGSTATLDGTSQGTITLAGTVAAVNNSNLFLNGIVDNTGEIQINAGVNNTLLRVADGTTLTGGGTIALDDNAGNLVFGNLNNAIETITNVNNTVEGSGTFGFSNSFEFINQKGGVVDATGTAAALVIAPTTNGTVVVPNGGGFVNLGLLEATNTAGLVLTNGQFNNAAGTILAAGAGNDVVLQNSATISGGLLEGTGGGEVQTQNNGENAFLDGTSQGAITLAGTFVAVNNSNLFLSGIVDNTGEIQINAAANNAQLRVVDGTTLTGGGTIAFDDSANNLAFGNLNSSGETVTNVNNTIEGSGTFGFSNSFEFINQKGGVIDATGTAAALVVQPTTDGPLASANGGGFVNLGLMEATNTAGLVLVNGQFNNATGTILATGTGDNVFLENNLTISGGLLESASGGEVETEANGSTATLDGTSQGAITLAGTFVQTNNSNVQLNGIIDNTGQFLFNPGANTTELRFVDGTTLTGGGTVTINDSGGNGLVFSNTNDGADVLTNANNLIQGVGQFGFSNSFGIVNGGTFSASGTTAFDLNPTVNNGLSVGADLVNQASGVLQGLGTGGLVITQGTLSNLGTIQALDASSVTFNSGVINLNASNGTLTGGTWAAIVTIPGDGATLQATGGTIDTDAADIIMSGSGATVSFYNGTSYVDIQNSLTSITAAGELDVLAGANFTAGTSTQAIANAGLVVLGGGTFADASFANSGTLTGFGEQTNTGGALANTGLVLANGGDLVLAQGVTGTGNVTIEAGASLDVSGASGGNTVSTLLHDGASLALGTQDITVATDYENANFGTGNSFNKVANVTGTGGILAAGTVTQVLTGSVTSGTSAAPVMAFGNIHVGDTATLGYAIGNAGTGGPVLRGAIQTTVGGGTLSDTRLTGAGVAASDFGPIAQGASTSVMGVVFTGSSAGSLVAQSVHIANNFANVAEQTLTFTGAAYRYADPTAAVPNPVLFGNHHVGDTVVQGLTLTNTDPNDGFSEALDASIGGASGNISASGSFTGLTASLTNMGGLGVTLNTGTAGDKSGQAVITLISDGNGIDGLGTTAIGTQTVTASGAVYRLASASTVVPNPVAFANSHVGDTVTQGLTLTNTDPDDGFSEALDASIGGATGNISAAGSFTGLTASLTNAGSLAVTLNTGTAGVRSGQAVISLISDGNGIDGLGTTSIGTQTVAVTGTVYRLAAASAYSPQPIDLGNRHVNDSVTQAITLTNTAAADGFSEALDASIGTATGAISAAGSFTGLDAGLSNTGSLDVTLNTGTAGVRSGAAVITLTSDGDGIDGLGTTSIGTQTVAVTGTVYRLAAASAFTPAPVDLGNVHVNDSVIQAITLTNTAAADGFSEALDASIGNASGNISAAGSFTDLGASLSTGSLAVTLNTGTAGDKSGEAVISLISDGNGIDGLGTTSIGTQTVAVTGTVYRLAEASPFSPAPVNFGNSHVGDSVSQGLTLSNTAAADGFSEALDASIGGASGDISAAGSFTGLNAGLTNTGSLDVTLNTGTAGVRSGQAVIALTSDGNGIDGLGTTSIGTQTVAMTGTVYRLAAASPFSPAPVNLGDSHVNDSVTQAITLTNTAAADGFSEALDASIGGASGNISAVGSFTGLSAGLSNSGSLAVTLNTGTAGVRSGQAVIALTSDGNGIDGLGTTSIGTQTVAVTGTVYRLAAASAFAPQPIDLGNRHVNDSVTQAITLTNTAAADGFSEALDASIGGASGNISAAGSFTGLNAGVSNAGSLAVTLNTGTAGDKSGQAVISLTSDGGGIDGLGTTAIGTQTVAVTGTVYRLAGASAFSPAPIDFGDSHVNDSVTQAITLTNTAAADGFSEALDASIGGASGDISAVGSFTGLDADQKNTGGLGVILNTGTAGVRSGAAVITLTSDGNGIDGLGTTSIGTQTVAVTGTVYRLAAASAYSPQPIDFANSHVNDNVTQAITLTNTAAADGFSEALDASIGNATGDISAAGSFTGLNAGLSNTGSLDVTLNTGTVGVQSGQAVISLTSDGNGIDGLDTTSIGTQTVAVTGTVYRLAAASPFTPAPVNLGNSHVNDSVTQAITLTNTAAADGFSEALDASIGGASGNVSAGGSFTGLTAGLSNSGSLAVTLNTGTDGAKSGQAVIALTSDGNGIDGLGTTSIGTQTVTVTGTVYAFAVPVISGTTLDFGATRTGEAALTQSTTITNGTSADPFQEALAYAAGAAPTGFAVTSNGAGTVASGGGDAVTGLSLATGTAGDFGGSIVVDLTSKAGGSGLSDTVLTAQTLTVSGEVFATAVAQLSTATLNFGVVHVGDLNLSQTLTITNAATGELTDSLIGQFGSVSGPFSGVGTLGVAADTSGTLSVDLDTTNAGSFSAGAPLDLSSHDADQADLGISAGPVTVTATIDNYATAAIDDISGAGALGESGQNYTLNFGTVSRNTGTLTGDLAVMNAASGVADLLTGAFGGETGGGFDLSGFGAIGTLSAGQSDSGLSVSLDTSVLGAFTETVTLTATGTNSSGFSGALSPEILTITGTVACFASGTRLATPHGEVAVERLAVGDELRTVLGGSGEIVWIGTRTVDCAHHPRPETVWPVWVAADAFGTGTPARTLYLSPDHAVYVDGVFVPVKLLVNGTTVRQVRQRLVTYYHVELPRHDVILAEGLTVESYLELGAGEVDGRANFDGGETIRLFPDFGAHLAPNAVLAWEALAAAPLVVTGPELAAARATVAAAWLAARGTGRARWLTA